APGGALTLDGPNPVIGTVPNSSQFVIDGNDLHSCGTPAGGPYPAIDGYDDPNASPPTTSVQTILNAIPTGRTGNYTGAGGPPSVQNGYGALGETMGTPEGLYALMQAIRASYGAHIYANNPNTNPSAGIFQYGSAAAPAINVVDGDA